MRKGKLKRKIACHVVQLITQADMNFDPDTAVCNPEDFWHAKNKSVAQIAPSVPKIALDITFLSQCILQEFWACIFW